MHYEIILAPEAVEDLRYLKASDRAQVPDTIERHLRHEPTKTSKSRIKRAVYRVHSIDSAWVMILVFSTT